MGTFLASWLTWQGLFVGVEQTAAWRMPLRQPGLSATVLASASIKRLGVRIAFIQPLQDTGLGPSLQFGASVRVF